jgi:hypothetical protein
MGVGAVAVPVCPLQPEHEAFKQLLAAPQEEARQIARRRFPVPKIVDCDQNGSQVQLHRARVVVCQFQGLGLQPRRLPASHAY